MTTVVGLGAWCDFVTPDEYRQRLVRDGWRATVERQSGARAHPAPFAPGSTEEVEELVEDFKQGLSFVVHEFADAGEHELKGVPDRWRLYRAVGLRSREPLAG